MLDFLVTPFLHEAALRNEKYRKFNKKFCPARVHIEQCIGIFKKRFPVLTKLKFRSRELAAKAIIVSLRE